MWTEKNIFITPVFTARLVTGFLLSAVFILSSSVFLGHLHAAASSNAEVDAVLALEADPDYGEYLAGECLTCHKPAGSDNIPAIHGQDPALIIGALIEYKNKTRENETMRSVAGALGNDEMAAIAAYFSKQSAQ